eukprot:1192524-Prymnesium_polylepis.1
MRNGCETGPGRFISKHYWVRDFSVHLHPFRYTTPTHIPRVPAGRNTLQHHSSARSAEIMERD